MFLTAECQTDVDRHLAMICSWAWSEQLLATLAPAGVDVDAMAEFLAGAANNRASTIGLVAADDVLSPSRRSNEQLVAALSSQIVALAHTFSPSDAAVLSKFLSIGGEGRLPHVSLLGMTGPQNRSSSWLVADMTWLVEIFDVSDELARQALTDPSGMRVHAIESQPVDFTTLCIVGPGTLSAESIDKILQSAREQAEIAEPRYLFNIIKTLGDLRGLSTDQCAAWRECINAVFDRFSQLDDVDEHAPGWLTYLEFAMRACLNGLNATGWDSLEFVVWSANRFANDNTEIREFVGVLRDVCPLIERPRFGRLYAELCAAAFRLSD